MVSNSFTCKSHYSLNMQLIKLQILIATKTLKHRRQSIACKLAQVMLTTLIRCRNCPVLSHKTDDKCFDYIEYDLKKLIGRTIHTSSVPGESQPPFTSKRPTRRIYQKCVFPTKSKCDNRGVHKPKYMFQDKRS